MPLLLEAFDLPPLPPEPAGPSPDWLDGHEAGLAQGMAQGRAEAEADAAHLTRELAQTLGDMAFAYAEARAQVLASLGPLFTAVLGRLLPQAADAALVPWIAERLAEAAAADTARPWIVAVHPDRIPALRAALPAGWPATLEPDPLMGPQAARIGTLAGESHLDLDACLATLREALAPLLDAPTPRALPA